MFSPLGNIVSPKLFSPSDLLSPTSPNPIFPKPSHPPLAPAFQSEPTVKPQPPAPSHSVPTPLGKVALRRGASSVALLALTGGDFSPHETSPVKEPSNSQPVQPEAHGEQKSSGTPTNVNVNVNARRHGGSPHRLNNHRPRTASPDQSPSPSRRGTNKANKSPKAGLHRRSPGGRHSASPISAWDTPDRPRFLGDSSGEDQAGPPASSFRHRVQMPWSEASGLYPSSGSESPPSSRPKSVAFVGVPLTPPTPKVSSPSQPGEQKTTSWEAFAQQEPSVWQRPAKNGSDTLTSPPPPQPEESRNHRTTAGPISPELKDVLRGIQSKLAEVTNLVDLVRSHLPVDENQPGNF